MATGGVVVLPWRVVERALRRVIIVVARVVLPSLSVHWNFEPRLWHEPEPGIPDMAIRRRCVGGVDWNLAGL